MIGTTAGRTARRHRVSQVAEDDGLVVPAVLPIKGFTLFDPRGWRALDAVKFAGSFEGQTTFAVGVDARVPFRVQTLPDDAVTHVVLDIAHGEG